MKYFALSVICIFLCYACDNTLDIIEEEQDIPIVYGFLSLSDTAQYIRLERAFVDENTSALELAQNPDSIYYPNANVALRRESTGEIYFLERVDGNLEGYEREDGVFAQSPNYLYKIKSDEIPLVGEESYTLQIDRGDGSEVTESTTVLLSQAQIRRPDPITANILDFDYVDRTRFLWIASESSRIYNLYIDFNYRERSAGTGGSFERKSVRWPVTKNLVADDPNRVEFEVEGLSFYSFLAGAIPVVENAERRFEDLDVIVSCGGTEIEEFVSIGSANLGITSTQDVPEYSNIPGGRGIFTSVNTDIVENINLSNPSLDSLRNGIITRDLNFIN